MHRVISRHSQKNISWYDTPEPYLTAAGEIEVKGELHIHSEALGDIRAKLLDTDNNIVSVGQRCMDIGYDFHWPPFTPPIITRPDGKKFHCTVRRYVPYVKDDGGTLCSLSATGEQSSSSSSSNRAPARDESQQQSAKNEPAVGEAALEAPEQKGHEDQLQPIKKDKNDDVPLLKIEATSLYHMMTHSPKNPYCQACQRAKMQRKPHRKSKTPVEERRQATEFADLVTGDHIITVAKVDKSIDGKSDGLVLYDVATGYMDCFPAYTKNTEETIQAILRAETQVWTILQRCCCRVVCCCQNYGS